MNLKAIILPTTSKHARAYLKLVLMSLLFGGTFVAGRVMGGEVSPALGATLRFIIASICLLLALHWQEKHFPIPTPKELFGLILLGLTGVFGYNLFFLQALETTEAGRTAAVIASNPILITLLSCLFLGEKLNWKKLSGILLSVTGAVIVASRGNLDILLHFSSSDKALLGALCCWALYSVIGSYILNTLTPLTSVAYSAVIGTVILLPVALLTTDISQISSYSLSAWMGILYLAIPGTVFAFLMFYQGIRDIGVVRAGVFINLIPVSTLVLSIFLLNEIPGISMLLGTALVITGVLRVNHARSKDAT